MKVREDDVRDQTRAEAPGDPPICSLEASGVDPGRIADPLVLRIGRALRGSRHASARTDPHAGV